MDEPVTSVLFCGVGGQGVLKASQILAETAMLEGWDVKKTEVHGMAQRGGSVVSHVRFGRQVFSPLIPEGGAQYLVAFEPLEALRYGRFLQPGGLVLINEQRIPPQPVRIGKAHYPDDIVSPLMAVAREVIATNATHAAQALGNARMMNVLMLGMLAVFLPFSEQNWLQVIQQHVPQKSLRLNQTAFLFGYDLARSSNSTQKNFNLSQATGERHEK